MKWCDSYTRALISQQTFLSRITDKALPLTEACQKLPILKPIHIFKLTAFGKLCPLCGISIPPKICSIEDLYLPLALVTHPESMIISFGSKETERIWLGDRVKKVPLNVQEIGRRKLRMLNNAVDLQDLRIPPANRLEKLAGNLKAFYSIRINDQWRIIFKWTSGNAFEVEILDYH